MIDTPTHIYAYRDGYYPYWTTDPDLHRDAAQYIRADIAVGAAVAIKNHLAGNALLEAQLAEVVALLRDTVARIDAITDDDDVMTVDEVLATIKYYSAAWLSKNASDTQEATP